MLQVPPLPVRGQVDGGAPAPAAAEAEAPAGAAQAPGQRGGFRLRASAALFTYNSETLRSDDWQEFLDWVATLDFVKTFTATLEKSCNSEMAGRLHLHLFVEFGRPVDWTSLRPMSWGGVTPNCQPTRARGPRWRDAVDQGHFYCWADKAGELLKKFSKSS